MGYPTKFGCCTLNIVAVIRENMVILTSRQTGSSTIPCGGERHFILSLILSFDNFWPATYLNEFATEQKQNC